MARAEGDWQARVESGSPSSLAARSNTTTPSHATTREMKIPSKKISIADYKSMKVAAKPSPRPGVEEGRQNGALQKLRDMK